MASIRVLAVGKARKSPLADAAEIYAERIRHWSALDVRHVPAAKDRRASERRAREARDLQALIEPKDVPIALDLDGAVVDSRQFGERLESWLAAGRPTFLIGGPDGLDDAIKSSCRARVAFGKITLPHELAFVVLLEQIYRAHAARSGHPYSSH